MLERKSYKIGAVDYKINIVPGWVDGNGDQGEAFGDKKMGNTIYVRDDLTPEHLDIVLLHEAIHQMNDSLDHAFVDSFARQIYAFLKDNDLICNHKNK